MPEYRLTRGKFAVVWRDEGGRHRPSLSTDSRAEADRLFARFVATRDDTLRSGAAITVAEAWEGYRKTLCAKPAATTMGFERRSVGPHFGNRSAADLTEADCDSYIAARRAKGRSDGTIWTELGRLPSALRWAEDKKLIDRAPKIYRPSPPPPRDLRLTASKSRNSSPPAPFRTSDCSSPSCDHRRPRQCYPAIDAGPRRPRSEFDPLSRPKASQDKEGPGSDAGQFLGPRGPHRSAERR